MNVGDKVIIHPEIGTFNRHLYPTIADGMMKYAGKEGTIIEIYHETEREPTVYRVIVGHSSWYFREEWLITENQTEISINLKDIQNLLL